MSQKTSVEIIKKPDIKIDAKVIEELLTKTAEDGNTIVQCSYISKVLYVNSGWVNISPITF